MLYKLQGVYSNITVFLAESREKGYVLVASCGFVARTKHQQKNIHNLQDEEEDTHKIRLLENAAVSTSALVENYNATLHRTKTGFFL